jgi:hypothetical protein
MAQFTQRGPLFAVRTQNVRFPHPSQPARRAGVTVSCAGCIGLGSPVNRGGLWQYSFTFVPAGWASMNQAAKIAALTPFANRLPSGLSVARAVRSLDTYVASKSGRTNPGASRTVQFSNTDANGNSIAFADSRVKPAGQAVTGNVVAADGPGGTGNGGNLFNNVQFYDASGNAITTTPSGAGPFYNEYNYQINADGTPVIPPIAGPGGGTTGSYGEYFTQPGTGIALDANGAVIPNTQGSVYSGSGITTASSNSYLGATFDSNQNSPAAAGVQAFNALGYPVDASGNPLPGVSPATWAATSSVAQTINGIQVAWIDAQGNILDSSTTIITGAEAGTPAATNVINSVLNGANPQNQTTAGSGTTATVTSSSSTGSAGITPVVAGTATAKGGATATPALTGATATAAATAATPASIATAVGTLGNGGEVLAAQIVNSNNQVAIATLLAQTQAAAGGHPTAAQQAVISAAQSRLAGQAPPAGGFNFGSSKTLLYVGLGVVALGAIAFIIMKKKKSGPMRNPFDHVSRSFDNPVVGHGRHRRFRRSRRHRRF